MVTVKTEVRYTEEKGRAGEGDHVSSLVCSSSIRNKIKMPLWGKHGSPKVDTDSVSFVFAIFFWRQNWSGRCMAGTGIIGKYTLGAVNGDALPMKLTQTEEKIIRQKGEPPSEGQKKESGGQPGA